MPELPEVETIVREIGPELAGKIVQAVEAPFLGCLEGDREICLESLRGRRISGVDRRGKYILIRLENGSTISIHLRMTGKLLFSAPESARSHIRFIWRFSDGTALHFVDARKFGRIRLWPKGVPLLPGLGPEPLNEVDVLKVLRGVRSARAVKTVLLDQRVLAGIGNIYADEALFCAGIHPETPFSKLTRRKLAALAACVPQILNGAVARRGTTLRDYRTAGGEPGENRPHLCAYGREGLPCCRCCEPMRRIRVGGRSSYYCPACQRRPRIASSPRFRIE